MATSDYETLTLKVGNTAPSIQHQLFPTTVDLTSATVRFHMKNKAGQVIIDAAANVDSVANRTVSYDWQVGDLAVAGQYFGEYEVTYADSTIETFPADGYIPITVGTPIA